MSNILISPESGIIEFNTGVAGGSSFVTSTAPIRLDATGGNTWFTGCNVGIGKIAPAYPLDVNGTIQGGTIYSNLFSVGNEGKVVSTATAGLLLQATAGSKPITFYTNVGGNTERMRIAADGSVGIGIDDPTENLEVSGNVTIGRNLGGTTSDAPWLTINGYDEHGIELYAHHGYHKWRISNAVNGPLQLYNTGSSRAQQVDIGHTSSTQEGSLFVWNSEGGVLRAGRHSTLPILDIGIQNSPAAHRGDAYIDVRDAVGPSRFHFMRGGEFIASGVSVTGTVAGTGAGGRITLNGTPYLLSGDSPAETQTLQDVTTNGNTTTTSILSTGPHISGVTGLFSDKVGINANPTSYALTVGGEAYVSSNLFAPTTYTNTIRDQAGDDVVIQDNGGNVGIGTNAPAYPLHVVGAGRPAVFESNNGSNITKFGNSTCGIATYNGLDINVNAFNSCGLQTYGMPLTFWTSTGNGIQGAERLRIANDGNVGIGTTTPSGLFHVDERVGASFATNYGIISDINGGANSTNIAGYFSATNSSYNVALRTVGANDFGGNVLVKGYIDQRSVRNSQFGNIFVGDLTNGYIAGNGGTIVFAGDALGQGVASATFASIRGVKENGSYNNSLGALVFGTQDDAGSNQQLDSVTEKMRITSAGYVGIGTDSPARKFHVNAGSLDVGIRLESSDALAKIELQDNGGTAWIAGKNGALHLQGGGSDTVGSFVIQDGDVGIGTSAPDAKLHISGSDASSSTNSFLVQNSAGVDMLSVDNGKNVHARDNLYVHHETVSSRKLRLWWGGVAAYDGNNELSLMSDYDDGGSNRIMICGPTADNFPSDTIQVQANNGLSIYSGNSPFPPEYHLHVSGDVGGTGIGDRITLNGTPYLLSGDAASALTLQDVCDNDNSTTTSILSTGPHISGVTGLFSERVHVGTPIGTHDCALEVAHASAPLIVADTTPVAVGVGGEVKLYGVYGAGGQRTTFASIKAKKTDAIGNSYGAGLAFYTRVHGGGGLTERLTILESGNVGIGTTAPTNNLHIVGTMQLDNSVSDAFKIRLNGNQGLAYDHDSISSTNAGYDITIQAGKELIFKTYDGGFNEAMRIDTDGNVGIGSTSPTVELDVASTGFDGSMKWTHDSLFLHNTGYKNQIIVGCKANSPTGSYLRLTEGPNTIYQGGYIQYDGSNNNLNIGVNDGGTAFTHDLAAITIERETAYVGIGTTAPITQLDVVGTGLFSSRVGIGTDAPTQPLEVVGNAMVDTLTIQDGSTAINRDGSVLRLYANAGTDISTWFGGYHKALSVRKGASDALIGINNGSPSYQLDVNGTGYFANGVLGTGVGNRITNNGVPYLLSGDSPAETQTLQDVTTNGNTTTTSMSVQGQYLSGVTGVFDTVDITGPATLTVTGNVGIGTAAPAYPLEVLGSVAGEVVRIRNTRDVGSEAGLLVGIAAGNGGLEIGKFTWGGSDTNALTIKGNSATFGGKVIVAGGDGSNAGYRFDSNGDTDGGILSPADGQISFVTDATERMRINRGNVGIGTTAPQGTLHLHAALSRNLLFTNPTIGAASSDGTYMGMGATQTSFYLVNQEYGRIYLGTDNTHRVEIDHLGRMGIGAVDSFDPVSKLHVNAASDDEVARFQSTDRDAYIALVDYKHTGYIGIDGDYEVLSLGFNTDMGSTSNVNITTGGWIGIGDVTPVSELNIQPETASITIGGSNTKNARLDTTFGQWDSVGDHVGTYHGQTSVLSTNGSPSLRGFWVNHTSSYAENGVTWSGPSLIGFYSEQHINTASHRGTIANQYGFRASAGINSCGVNGAVTNAYGAYIELLNNDSDGTVTNSYGVYIDDTDTAGASTNRYGIYSAGSATKNYFQGLVGIGTATPGEALDVNGHIRIRGNDRSLYFDGDQALFKTASAGVDFEFQNSSATTNVIFTDEGSVGIGIASPTEDLEVSGNVLIGESNYGAETSWLRLNGYGEHGVQIEGHGGWTKWRVSTEVNGNLEIYNTGSSDLDQQVYIGHTEAVRNANVMVWTTGSALSAGRNSTTYPILDFGIQDAVHGYNGDAYIDVRTSTTPPSRFHFKKDGEFIASGVGVSGDVVVQGGDIDIGTNDLKGAANCKIEMDAANGFKLTNPNNAHGIDFYGDDLTILGGALGYRKIITDAGNLSIEPVADLLLNENGGSVGIGTITPEAQLDVRGSGYFSERVGIGTSAPDAMLHISGGSALIQGISQSYAKFYHSVSASDYVSTSANVFALNSYYATNEYGIYVNNAGNFSIAKSGSANALVISNNHITMTGSNLKFESIQSTTSPAINLRGAENGDEVGIYSPATNKFSIVTDRTDRVVVDAVGSVGIGTTSPIAQLDVVGTGLFSSRVGIGTDNPSAPLDVINDSSADGIQLKDAAGGMIARLGADGSNNARARFFNGAHNIVAEINGNTSNPTYFDAGKVGIGLSNPAETLHVDGNILIPQDKTLQGYYGGSIPHPIIGMSSTIDTIIYASGNNSSDIFFKTNSGGTLDTRMTILNAGKVGIGTTGPANKLDVAGGIAVGASYVGGSAPSNGAIIQGNVGIGTNNPAVALDVAGVIKHQVYAIGSLPAVSPAGQRAFVNNNYYAFGSSTVGQTVYAGGSSFAPVYSDGSYWRLG